MGKLKFAAALAALAAVLALPAGAADTSPAPASITVSGSGSATSVPTISRWGFGVNARGDTATAALRSVSTQMRAVIAALKAAGVAPADIQTQSVSLSPQPNSDGTKIIGYAASQSLSATLRNLDQAGAIVDGAVAAGADTVFGPGLAPASQDALERQALQAAFDNAKAKAQALAERAGVTLGKPLSIAEATASRPIPFVGAGKAAAPTDSVAIEPGQSAFETTVTVTYAIS
jgi:uncharacterized protein YggE